ncbi:hypothetical protein [Salinigranum sp. GCM10025319]|uniref:hypothetical protein n=1 Tax=Salinigranum sp. GCM10025319 TaxID=3252687 RepID=UPI00360F7219
MRYHPRDAWYLTTLIQKALARAPQYEMPSLLDRLLGDDQSDEQIGLESRQADADEALHDAVERGRCDIEDCGVTGIAVVNEGPNDDPVVVPVARFSLGEDVEDPDMTLVWNLVGEAAGLYSAEAY